MKKIGILIVMILSMIFFHDVVYASEIYYINENGVEFSQEEYDILSQFFWEGYQDNMNDDDYNYFLSLNLLENGVETEYLNQECPLSSQIITNKKTLKISKSCSTNCFISVVAQWTQNPVTRSYDVIGAYLENVSRVGALQTTMTAGGNTNTGSYTKTATNGFGVSIKIPTVGSNVIANQTYTVSTGGTVYASYQHASSVVSLNQSKQYTFSRNGYGGVFAFDSSVASKYDGMRGVSISV